MANPSNRCYAEGTLLGMNVVKNRNGDTSVYLTLSVKDNFKSKAGGYMSNGQMVDGYADQILQFQGYVKSDKGLGIFANLRDPADGSDRSCDKGAKIGLDYHLTSRDSGKPVLDNAGQPIISKVTGKPVNQTIIECKVDSVYFRETTSERDARRAAYAAKHGKTAVATQTAPAAAAPAPIPAQNGVLNDGTVVCYTVADGYMTSAWNATTGAPLDVGFVAANLRAMAPAQA